MQGCSRYSRFLDVDCYLACLKLRSYIIEHWKVMTSHTSQFLISAWTVIFIIPQIACGFGPEELKSPSVVTPASKQVHWQSREVEAMVHFGLNTFTGKEVGSGREPASRFNPTNLSASHWVSVAQSFGAK